MFRLVKITAIVLVAAALLATSLLAINVNEPFLGGLTPVGYLPVILKPLPTPTFTATPTASPTPTATATPPATATPTSTPTATSAPAVVHITYILYNPDGDDVQNEYVRIENHGGSLATMTGWTLRDEDNHIFTFPSFALAPHAQVQVWTKCGTNTGTDLYYCSGQAIWNNNGDTAFLRDNGGNLIDSCSYPGGGISTSCN